MFKKKLKLSIEHYIQWISKNLRSNPRSGIFKIMISKEFEIFKVGINRYIGSAKGPEDISSEYPQKGKLI